MILVDNAHNLNGYNNGEENNELLLEDFPPNSLIHLVAKRDIHLACEILKTYGGQKNYLPKQESIQRCARDREITELRIMLKLPGDIAKEFGLSRNRILKIIRKGLNLRFPCGPS
jgi:Mor family transcriptional regulator